jgi:hypothetical protein
MKTLTRYANDWLDKPHSSESSKSLGCAIGLGCLVWVAFYGAVLALIICGILFLLGVLPA